MSSPGASTTDVDLPPRAAGDAGRRPALEAVGVADADWARSGAMALTGRADGPPRPAPGPLATRARRAVQALAALAGERWRGGELDGAALLGERAACLGLRRRGTVSPGGGCRLLRAADDWIALHLARPDDVALLPAWLEDEPPGGRRRTVADPWPFAAERVARRSAATLLERAAWLGLAVARAGPPPATAPPAWRTRRLGRARAPRPGARPLVIDLSALWAGPLAAHLLALAGARVVKVESTTRPDGARRGDPRLFDLLNEGKQSVALDFGDPRGRASLRRLLARADIVIESARPRALRQLGIEAESLLRERPGLTWLGISGYGREGTHGLRVAYGDDAAVAAGLARAVAEPGGPPLFCGDAIADPLAGVHAALAAFGSWRAGGGRLLDVALRDVAAYALLADPRPTGAPSRAEPPRARAARGPARPLGADTDAVLREPGTPC